MKVVIAIFLFFLIFTGAKIGYAEEEKYEFRRDFPEQFNLKFNERIRNATDYIMIDYCLKENFFSQPDNLTNFCFTEKDRLELKIKTDLEDSVVYAGKDFFLRSDFGKKIRRYFIRITSIEIAKSSDSNRIETKATVIYEPLEPIEEKIRKKENELSSLSGDSLEVEKEKRKIGNEIDALRSQLAKKYDFRWKIGVNLKPNVSLAHNSFNAELEPFVSLQIGNLKFQTAYFNDYKMEKDGEVKINLERDSPKKNFYPSLSYNYDISEQTDKAELKFRKRFPDENFDITFGNQYLIDEDSHRARLSLNKSFRKFSVSLNTETDWRENYSVTTNLLFPF